METNKNSNDWRKSWQKQLDHYSVTPPPEVWEGLSEELAPRVRVGRRAVLWAAAACAAILIGCFVGLQYLSPGIPAHETPLQTAQADRPTTGQPTPALSNEPSASNPATPLYTQAQSPANGHTARAARRPVTPAASLPTAESEPIAELQRVIPDTTSTTGQPGYEAEAHEQPAQPATPSPRTRKGYSLYPRSGESEQAAYRPARTQTRTSGSWTVGLSLGNSLITAADNRSGFGNLAPYATAEMASLPSPETGVTPNGKEASASPYQQIMLQNINAQPTTDVKHHFPISVGVTVQKSLNPALALETGLVYTYLASDLMAGDAAYYTQKQQLHYLGIPLKLQWNFLRKHYFNLYVIGGGMAEKCIYGSLSSHYEANDRPSLNQDEQLSIDPLQWSVSAAVGITLKLAPHVNLYAEPGVAYYFDDGSQVSTIRKEKPFNLNLQAGLRFDF